MQGLTTTQWQCVLSLHSMVGATEHTITRFSEWILTGREVEQQPQEGPQPQPVPQSAPQPPPLTQAEACAE